MSTAHSSFPRMNTLTNSEGGTTTKIGNMMIITGYRSGIGGTVYAGSFGETFLYPMMTVMLSWTSYGTALFAVMNGSYSQNIATGVSGYAIVAAAGTGTFQGGGAWNFMYTAVGMI